MSDFSVEAQAQRSLPPATLTHDAKKILDSLTLVPIIRELMAKLGAPEFSTLVYLSIHTPIAGTRTMASSGIKTWQEEICSPELNRNLWKEDKPLLQNTLLWQHGETVSMGYAILGNQLIKEYCDAFYQAGYQLQGIDLISLSVLRAMAASGVLDALIRKIGPEAFWGCFGISGSQTWCILCQGGNLMYLDHFTTPPDQKGWEQHLQEAAVRAGVEKPKIWFAWQETGMQSPIDPLTLHLNAPIRPAILGPFYGSPHHQPSFPALGAALKPEIAFPLGWDFLGSPEVQDLRVAYDTVPYINFQPLLPKLVFRVALTLFVLMIGMGGYFALQNRYGPNHDKILSQQYQAALMQIRQHNAAYLALFSWINENSLEGIQIERMDLQEADRIKLAGNAYDAVRVEKYLQALQKPQSGGGLSLNILEKTTRPVEKGLGKVRFEFTGQLVWQTQAARGQKMP